MLNIVLPNLQYHLKPTSFKALRRFDPRLFFCTSVSNTSSIKVEENKRSKSALFISGKNASFSFQRFFVLDLFCEFRIKRIIPLCQISMLYVNNCSKMHIRQLVLSGVPHFVCINLFKIFLVR
jgi:hypothetical protein